MIGAATLGANRRLIGLAEDFGPLTLHAVVDGQSNETATRIDSHAMFGTQFGGAEVIDDSMVEKTIELLSGFVRASDGNKPRNLFHPQESWEDEINQRLSTGPSDGSTHPISATESKDSISDHVPATEPSHGTSQTQNIVKLKMEQFDGTHSLLLSDQIYSDERSIGINMPVDDLLKVKERTIILVGASGCGKTRTCYDFARYQWCLYYDCSEDADFRTLIRLLIIAAPSVKSPKEQQKFEDISEHLLRCLIVARIIVLQVWRKENPNETSFKWFCIQRSHGTRLLLQDIFTALSKKSHSLVSRIFTKLRGRPDDYW
ncbi:hypothetical protein CcCBS67573_g10688, partial [Chytriomyces confervae]